MRTKGQVRKSSRLIFKVVFTNTVSIKDNKHSTSVTNIARSLHVYKHSFHTKRIILFVIFNSLVHPSNLRQRTKGFPQHNNEVIWQIIFPKLAHLILRFIS